MISQGPFQHCFSMMLCLILVASRLKYIDVCLFQGRTSHCKPLFARRDLPEEIMSDNELPFHSGDSKTCGGKWDFIHKTSSPMIPLPPNELSEIAEYRPKGFLKIVLGEKKIPNFSLHKKPDCWLTGLLLELQILLFLEHSRAVWHLSAHFSWRLQAAISAMLFNVSIC